MADLPVSPSTLFILARDQAFFKTLFFTADRGSDLGCVKTTEIMHFAKDDGFLFNHVWGKTLRDGACNVWNTSPFKSPAFCFCILFAIINYLPLYVGLAGYNFVWFVFRPDSQPLYSFSPGLCGQF